MADWTDDDYRRLGMQPPPKTYAADRKPKPAPKIQPPQTLADIMASSFKRRMSDAE